LPSAEYFRFCFWLWCSLFLAEFRGLPLLLFLPIISMSAFGIPLFLEPLALNQAGFCLAFLFRMQPFGCIYLIFAKLCNSVYLALLRKAAQNLRTHKIWFAVFAVQNLPSILKSLRNRLGLSNVYGQPCLKEIHQFRDLFQLK